MLYMHKFFKTETEARAYKKSHGGAMYSGKDGSKTRQSYTVEACMEGMTEKQMKERPYCVAWNVVEGGPIQPDDLAKENGV